MLTESSTLADYDGASVPVLEQALSSESPQIRSDAACALGDRLRSSELAELDQSVLDTLTHLLDDPFPGVRLEAAIALAEAHDHRASPVLVGALSNRDVRLDATRALGTMGDPNAIRPLQKLMGRWLLPWADKLQAAAALCALDDPLGAQYLMSRLESRRRAERAAAIHFLAESKHPDALRVLTEIIHDRADPMRDVAFRALNLLPGDTVRTLVREIERDADPALREALQEA